MDDSAKWLAAAWAEIDIKTKPQKSLGLIEDWGAKLVVLKKSLKPRVSSGKVLLFAADHGLADEDVSPFPKQVTPQMLINLSLGGAAINAFCRASGLDLEVIDVGVDNDKELANITVAKHPLSAHGTLSSLRGPAMTPEELEHALEQGRQAVQRAVAASADPDSLAIGIGELGIGNTGTAACLLAAESRLPAEEVTGSGTGAEGERLRHKIATVAAVTDPVNGPHAEALAKWPDLDFKDVLRRIGGLEIAAMVGAIRAAILEHHVPVLVDGIVTLAAYLFALRISAPEEAALLTVGAFLAHQPDQSNGSAALERIRIAQKSAIDQFIASDGQPKPWNGQELWKAEPLFQVRMRLGEGTGAALAFPTLKAAAHLVTDMATFASAGVSESKE
ncbi:nicotinate-nucleotide-dimethylbenzimidazole phosphoribosyltransferase-like protein [Cladochytrium replicatum]|nr:nicotinate-nucleotide-dimethylbenzimidazole phosphoribosyltransferase-like protein [Cladochytrium replicatum]